MPTLVEFTNDVMVVWRSAPLAPAPEIPIFFPTSFAVNEACPTLLTKALLAEVEASVINLPSPYAPNDRTSTIGPLAIMSDTDAVPLTSNDAEKEAPPAAIDIK